MLFAGPITLIILHGNQIPCIKEQLKCNRLVIIKGIIFFKPSNHSPSGFQIRVPGSGSKYYLNCSSLTHTRNHCTPKHRTSTDHITSDSSFIESTEEESSIDSHQVRNFSGDKNFREKFVKSGISNAAVCFIINARRASIEASYNFTWVK